MSYNYMIQEPKTYLYLSKLTQTVLRTFLVKCPEIMKVFPPISLDFGSSPNFDLKYMYFHTSSEIWVIIKLKKKIT